LSFSPLPGNSKPAAAKASPAAPQSQLARHFLKTVWTVQDGLPQNTVTAILQTRDGYLWLATFGGLARFDGMSFTVFNSGNTPGLSNNRMLSLFEDHAGAIWIGTETGDVIRLRGGQAITYTADDGLPRGLVWSFSEDSDGTLWIGTTSGLVEWRDGVVRIYGANNGLPGNRIWSMSRVSDGHLWLGSDGGVIEFSNKRGEARTPPGTSVRLVRPQPDGSIVFAMRRGLGRISHGRLAYGEISGLREQSSVRDLIVDTAGNIWLGYFQAGIVSRLKAGANRLEEIEIDSEGVRALAVDQEGNLWVGTEGAGLMRLKERRVTAYSVEDGLPSDSVQAITDDGGDGVWIATRQGLARLTPSDSPKLAVYSTKDGLPDPYIFSLYREAGGTLWVGGALGLSRYKEGVFTTVKGFSGTAIQAIASDREGGLWVGTDTGLNRLRDEQFVAYPTPDPLFNNIRFILPARDGSLWLGSVGGLSHFQNGAFTHYTSREGLSNDYVRTIVEQDDGTLWIGTYGGGLNRFKDGRFVQIRVNDGLFDDFISQIVDDNRGRFWMLSNRGIFHAGVRELNEFADRRTGRITCISYGVADGMKSSEGNGGSQPSGWRAPDGRLWFATIKGVVVVDPSQETAIAPRAMIEQVVLDRQPLPVDQGVRIGAPGGNLEIHYTGLSFSRPEQLRFRYRMTGLDNDWVDAGTRRVAYYPHLPAGEYVFAVISASSDGIWNDAAATLTLVVAPPFWRTWWFLLLTVVFAFAILLGAYKRRVEHLKEAHAAREAFSRQLLDSQERERQRIAAELHDGLGQSLLIIKNRAFLASSAIGDPAETQEQLNEITASASQAIDEVRTIAHNLRPYQLDRFGLTRTLRAIFTSFPHSSRIRFSAEIDAIDGLFSKQDEISIYRIVQESTNNIVKHADATEAQLSVDRNGREVQLRIRDNGRGFKPGSLNSADGRSSGFGLAGMAERVRMMGGSLAIDSAPGNGTTIIVKLSIQEARQ
jgi:signal transduction histidine kinase/ligand-binding sensor domain-containing protein